MTQQKCQYNVDIWHAFRRNQIETDPEIRNRVRGWHSRDRRGTKIDGEPDLRRLAAGKTEQADPPRLYQPAQGPRSGGKKPVALPTQVDAIIGDQNRPERDHPEREARLSGAGAPEDQNGLVFDRDGGGMDIEPLGQPTHGISPAFMQDAFPFPRKRTQSNMHLNMDQHCCRKNDE
jgi:hypothetical protein